MGLAINKPHVLIWLAIPVLLLTGAIFSRHTIDIQLYDTYYVIGNSQFVFASILLLLVVGAGYWLIVQSNRIPNRTLTTLHLLLTIPSLILCTIPLFGRDVVTPDGLLLSLTALLAGQLLYVVNLLITLLRRSQQ